MTESALERTARALDLVPYLLEHQGISTAELASVFRVSEKQINEDLVLIHMCGLPGYTPLELIDMYYEDGYVTVSDPQSFKRPRKMGRSEMASILVSLDLLKSMRTDGIRNEIENLQTKLLSSLKFENPFVVVQDLDESPFLQKLELGIAKSSSFRIVYLSGTKDERTERIIFPLEIYRANQATYVSAWCNTSGADRTFRVDRIIECEVITEAKMSQSKTRKESSVERQGALLLIDKVARNFIDDNRAIIESIEVVPGSERVLVELNPVDEDWLVRTILGFGGGISVKEPLELVEELVSRAEAIRLVYEHR
jgi:proteasome accessory factor C